MVSAIKKINIKLYVGCLYLIVISMMSLLLVNNSMGADTAFLDMQKALNSCNAGVQAKILLKKNLDFYQGEINILQDELKKRKEDIKANNIQDDDKIAQQFKKDLSSFQEYYKFAKEKLNLGDKAFSQTILDQITLNIKEYQKSSTYKAICVLPNSKKSEQFCSGNGLLAGINVHSNINDSDDITDKLIEYINNKQKNVDAIIASMKITKISYSAFKAGNFWGSGSN